MSKKRKRVDISISGEPLIKLRLVQQPKKILIKDKKNLPEKHLLLSENGEFQPHITKESTSDGMKREYGGCFSTDAVLHRLIGVMERRDVTSLAYPSLLIPIGYLKDSISSITSRDPVLIDLPCDDNDEYDILMDKQMFSEVGLNDFLLKSIPVAFSKNECGDVDIVIQTSNGIFVADFKKIIDTTISIGQDALIIRWLEQISSKIVSHNKKP